MGVQEQTPDLQRLGECHMQLQQFEEAIKLHKQHLALAGTLSASVRHAEQQRALYNISIAYLLWGDSLGDADRHQRAAGQPVSMGEVTEKRRFIYAEACKHAKKSRSLAECLGDSHMVSQAVNVVSFVENLTSARAAYPQDRLEMLRDAGLALADALAARTPLASLTQRRRLFKKAMDRYEEALEIARQVVAEDTPGARAGLARIYHQMGAAHVVAQVRLVRYLISHATQLTHLLDLLGRSCCHYKYENGAYLVGELGMTKQKS